VGKDPLAAALQSLPVVHVVGRSRGQIGSPLDGRCGALRPHLLQPLIERLAHMVDLKGLDVVVGIPEAGNVPAYAFAALTGLPLVLATNLDLELPGLIDFSEEHALPAAREMHVYGLSAGQRALIVEDEITTGNTVLNCVRAMRAFGVHIDQVASVLAVDEPEARARLEAEDLRVHVAEWLPADLARRLDRGV
jgi:adenine/guanine phosphoribosyltransferase-like PRPP-binding protein